MAKNLSEYFQRSTGARSIRAIATAIDVEASTLNRQLAGSTSLPIETVVAICRAYKLDFADTFVAAGYITNAEAQRLGARFGLDAYSDLDLAREIVRRIEDGTAGDALMGDLPVLPTPLRVRGRVHDVDDHLAAADERDGEDETDEGFDG